MLFFDTTWTPGACAIAVNNPDATRIIAATGFDDGTSYSMVFQFYKTSNTSNTIKYTCGSCHVLGGSGADTLQIKSIWGLI